MTNLAGADLGFSCGGVLADFQKILLTFFRPTKMIFRALPKHLQDILNKKSRFFGAHPPLKINKYWRQKRL